MNAEQIFWSILGFLVLILVVGVAFFFIAKAMKKKDEALSAEADRISAEAKAEAEKRRLDENQAKREHEVAIAEATKNHGQIKRRVKFGDYENTEFYPMAATDYGNVTYLATEKCKEFTLTGDSLHVGPGLETLQGMALLERAKARPEGIDWNKVLGGVDLPEAEKKPASEPVRIELSFVGIRPAEEKPPTPERGKGEKKEEAKAEPPKKSLLGD